MKIRYLHTMVRVLDLEKSMAFYRLLGLEETRRMDSEAGRFSLIFMAPPGQPECPVELTWNWDGDEGLPSASIVVSEPCTWDDDRLRSHRQDGGVKGLNQALAAWIS